MKSKLMFLFLCFLVWPYNKHLINRVRSVFYGRILTSVADTDLIAFGLVLAPSVKILPYRPPARLIRAKNFLRLTVKSNLFCRRLMVKF